MKLLTTLLTTLLLFGCTTMGDVSKAPLAVATHSDLTAAAAYATAHGYPARAAVWTSIDAQLTACESAITANEVQPLTGTVGVFTTFEIGAELAGTGIPLAVKLNCAPLPLVVFPGLPKLP